MIELKSLVVVFAVASTVIACSSEDSGTPSAPTEGGAGTTGTAPSVKITKPHEGESFALTPDIVDVDVDFDVQHFELVLLGQEGTDMGKGQVRLFVDGDSCNDPGEPPAEPPSPYNKIWPNDAMEKHVGMDYCAGLAMALDNKTHTLKAQLWHGETVLPASDQITFKTTFSADGGTAEPADGAAPATDSAGLADTAGQ
jgi:hypothetical protein